MRRQIYVADERVNNALDKQRNVSRFIVECVLYYLDSAENGYVTADQVKGIVLDCMKDIPTMSGPISNSNYVNEAEGLEEDVMELLNL